MNNEPAWNNMKTLKPFSCPFCKAYLHSFERRQEHKYRHTLKYTRTQIRKKAHTYISSTPDEVQIHIGEDKMHVNDTCVYSKKNVTDTKKAKPHVRSHTKQEIFKCRYCHKLFVTMDAITRHIRRHIEAKFYRCEYCMVWFAETSHLKVHIRSHTKEKPYKCEHCQKNFVSRGTLKRHTRMHTKEKPYKCERCQKCFSRNDSLKGHMRTHTKQGVAVLV